MLKPVAYTSKKIPYMFVVIGESKLIDHAGNPRDGLKFPFRDCKRNNCYDFNAAMHNVSYGIYDDDDVIARWD